MTNRGYQAIAHLDCIQLAGIAAQGRHGVYPSEREHAQPFVADVDMYCDLASAAASDSVEDTTDYSRVAAAVREVLSGQAHNLIETVAARVAATVLEFPQVSAVRVRIHKPQAPMDTPADDVAVTLWRGLGFDQDDEDAQRGDSEHAPDTAAALPDAAGLPDSDPQAAAAADGPADAPARDGGSPGQETAAAPAAAQEPPLGRVKWEKLDLGIAPDLADPDELDAGPEPGFPGLDHKPRWPRSAVLALGANLGNRRQTLLDVVGQLDHTPGIGVTEVSALIQSAAVLAEGQQSQPDYLNAIVIVQTSLSPRELLATMQQLEAAHGRKRTEKWGPRTLDIDIITYQGVYSEDPELTLPHPRAASRAFVLLPWSYLDPDAKLAGTPVAELAERAPDQRGIRCIDPLWLRGVTLNRDRDRPLPLPQWKSVADETPRILDDPESVVRSQEPVDPRLSMAPKQASGNALGLAGVSDRAEGGVSQLAPYDPGFARAQLRPPSLWQRIKAFFTGKKAQPQVVKVVDTQATSSTAPASVPQPPLPRVTAAPGRPRQLDVEAPPTAVEGMDTVSLRTLDTAAMERVEAQQSTADTARADAAPQAAEKRALPDNDTAGAAPRSEQQSPAVLPPDAPTTHSGESAPASTPAQADAADLANAAARIPAAASTPEESAERAVTDPGAPAPAAPAAADADAASALDPVPDPAPASVSAPAPAPAEPALPRGLARLFANADLSTPELSLAEDAGAAEKTQNSREKAPVAVPPAPPRDSGPAASLPQVPKPPRHAAPADPSQVPPPPPIPAPMAPPETQEFSAQDIAEAGRAAQQTPVRRASIIRPTTTGIIPAVKKRADTADNAAVTPASEDAQEPADTSAPAAPTAPPPPDSGAGTAAGTGPAPEAEQEQQGNE